MKRARQPHLAMSPQALPLQRLYLVTGLPTLPKGWTTERVADGGAAIPSRLPGAAFYLGQVEWAWSPMHSRISAYYTSQSSDRRHWLLWIKSYDDNYCRWATAYVERSALRRGGLKPLQAAQLLLYAYWCEERDEGVDHFHWVAEEGDLDVSDLRAVANAVWEG